MTKYLLPLIDGGIVKIETDSEYSPGCETCDYGSLYINDFNVLLSTGNIYVRAENMYEYALSEGYLMELILPNTDLIKGMTERGFFEWVEESLRGKFGSLIDICEFNANA